MKRKDEFEQWGGYMAAKISKLEEQFTDGSSCYNIESQLFAGVSVFVNGLTNPSSDEIKRIMMTHGGVYHTYQRSHTKYIIASNLAKAKFEKSDNTKIISATWITDCLKENRLIDATKYLLTNTKANIFETKKDQVAQNTTITNNKALTAAAPSFLSEFYNRSRLHLIATLAAELKDHITELRKNTNYKLHKREKLLTSVTPRNDFRKYSQIIMHIDIDCFFVSVGLRSRPHLRGQPVAVSHSKGTKGSFQENNNTTTDEHVSMSEVASCSYEARQMGLRNGMLMGHALKLCPDLKIIPYDFKEYRDTAYALYETVSSYTLDIEAVSCDEMYVNLTDLLNDLQMEINDFVQILRDDVKSTIGCNCSAGIGSNKIQARMATKRAKPNGQFFLESSLAENYMKNIPIKDLPGVGYSTLNIFEQLKLETCGDIQAMSINELQKSFSKAFAQNIYQLCRGIDERPLVYNKERKSISAEVNYGIRFANNEELTNFLNQLCEEVHARLKSINKKGKCITLKLMVRAKDAPVEPLKFMGHGVCDNFAKSISLPHYTCELGEITKSVFRIYHQLSIPPEELRGLGIQISKLSSIGNENNTTKNLLKDMFKNAGKLKKDISNEKFEISKVDMTSKSVSEEIDNVKNEQYDSSCYIIDDLTNLQKVLLNLPNSLWGKLLSNQKLKLFRKSAFNQSDGIRNFLIDKNDTVKGPMKKTFPINERFNFEFSIINNKSITIEIVPKKNNTNFNIFLEDNWREILQLWIDNSDYPLNYDVIAIKQSISKAFNGKCLDELYLRVKYFHRIVAMKENRKWHDVYEDILSTLQDEAVALYGVSLYWQIHFNCPYCDNIN